MYLRGIADVLGGEVNSGRALAPGPGHSHRDRSLSVWLDPGAPHGIRVHSFANDDWRVCLDYVLSKLKFSCHAMHNGLGHSSRRAAAQTAHGSIESGRAYFARTIWKEAVDPRGTLVEQYLVSRQLTLTDEIAYHVIRFHPRCPWTDERGNRIAVPAMVCAMTDICTNEFRAIHRRRLTP